MKDTVIVYHGNCPDGFGGAYAAWKKFGGNATYIGATHGSPAPDLTGKEVFMIDFSFPKDILLQIESKAKRLVVLDHHEGAKDAVEAVKEHIFDNDHSGSGIAWKFFHDATTLPRLLAYIQDRDLWKNSLPDGKAVSAYLNTMPFEFATFDALAQKMDSEEGFREIIQKGQAYSEYAEHAIEHLLTYAQEVQFEEFTILAANAPRLFRSELGHRLATQRPPFAIVWFAAEGQWHFSMRSEGAVDVSEIARRFGGNGHHNAASFRLPFGSPLPFTLLSQ